MGKEESIVWYLIIEGWEVGGVNMFMLIGLKTWQGTFSKKNDKYIYFI